MRIVVVGATGNVGTAVLRRLHAAPEATELVGVARRSPTPAPGSGSPYLDVSWHEIDISEMSSVELLTRAFAEADAVVHLGWALQSNRDIPALWQTNVGGTARVLEAVAAASVPQVVLASSVGAYSGGSKTRRVDEDWPTGGLHTSHYSRHKAINERAFDAFEEAHPDILVTRMRPGLVFQSAAATEIAQLFLGRRIPVGLLVRLRFPVLPLPTSMVFQAIDADDLADAFWKAIEHRESGAFNVAAEPVLTPRVIAAVYGAKTVLPIGLNALRSIVWLSWTLRLQRTDPGWIDIATNVPIMSTERARTRLGWLPRRSATDALGDILAGLARGDRVESSPPLRGKRP